jgi:hypothetical protein
VDVEVFRIIDIAIGSILNAIEDLTAISADCASVVLFLDGPCAPDPAEWLVEHISCRQTITTSSERGPCVIPKLANLVEEDILAIPSFCREVF